MAFRSFAPAITCAYVASTAALFSACTTGSGTGSGSSGGGGGPAQVAPLGDDGAGSDGTGIAQDGGTIADGQVPTTKDVDPGTPHVQLIGRFDMRDTSGPKCAWPGCRIVARFEGTQVSVKMNEIYAAWMEGAPSEWDVAIDGAWGAKLVMAAGASDYVLASGLPHAVHTVELYKRSEAQNGTTQFMGFDFGSGTLLAPPPRRTRRIEIIADSAAAGFGVEGVGLSDAGDCPGPDHGARWQNFRVSLGAKLADFVGAELFGTVHSGKGIAKNIWHPDKATLPVIFPRIIPVDPTSTWDFSWKPDVVVVMAGGNDFAIGQPVDEGPATLEQFIAEYDAFVGTLRQQYPAAHLFLTVSPSVSDAEPPARYTRTNVTAGVQAVTQSRNGKGDARVYWHAPAVSQPHEMTGCNGHGNRQFHESVAQELAAVIKPKVGW